MDFGDQKLANWDWMGSRVGGGLAAECNPPVLHHFGGPKNRWDGALERVVKMLQRRLRPPEEAIEVPLDQVRYTQDNSSVAGRLELKPDALLIRPCGFEN